LSSVSMLYCRSLRLVVTIRGFAKVAIVLHKSPLGHGIPNIEKFSFENQTATFAKPLLALV